MQDTLVIDSTQIAQWQAQNDFDYNRELVEGGMSVTQWLMMKLAEWVDELFMEAAGSTVVNVMLSALAVAVLGFIAWYLWRYHPGLFSRQEQAMLEEENLEDNIYGVDFDAAIGQAVGHENYREAVRLRYLQTLKALTDARLIDWQPYKTPTQYVRELSLLCSGAAAAPPYATSPLSAATPPHAPNPAAFRTLTAHFLRVRYGNFPATRELYDELCRLRKEVCREP